MDLDKKSAIKSLPISLARTDLEHKCLSQGVRITYARRVILGILEQANGHLTTEDVYRCALNSGAGVSISSVYSNIRALVKANVIKQRRFQAKQSYYTASYSELHDQLIDIESGRVIEFCNENLEKLKASIAQEYGFSAANCRVEFYSHIAEKQPLNKQL